MAASVRFPIRRKLLLLFTGLVAAATVVYLGLALRLFSEDRTLLVAELTQQSVKGLAQEIDGELSRFAETLGVLVEVDPTLSRAAAALAKDPAFLGVEVQASDGSVRTATQTLSPEWLKKLHASAPNKAGFWNDSYPELGPVGVWRFEVPGKSGARALLWLSLAPWIKRLDQPGVVKSQLVAADGVLLAAPGGEARVMARESQKAHPLLAEAIDAQVRAQTRRFSADSETWIGGFAHVPAGGIAALAQVQEREANRAALQLMERSLLFGLLVLTVGLLLSRRVARTLTDPIQELVAATQALAKGDWERSIHVRSRDEIGLLAGAFNAMSSDLRAQHTQLERQTQELERKVKERTETLESEKRRFAETQEALVRTTKLASLGELAGAAAHEVLNPVNNMNIRIQKSQKALAEAELPDLELLSNILQAWEKAYAEGGFRALHAELEKPAQSSTGPKTLLQEDLENLKGIARDGLARAQARKEDLDFLSKEMLRVTRIVNNMRALSRVGGERKSIDIHQALDATWVAQKDLFERKKIQWIKDYSADPRTEFQIVADVDELVQVFSNLTRNALQAVSDANRRSGEIRISTRRTPERVEIRLTDNGTGIPKANLAKLFEANFTTKSLDEGTGLGLSISRRIVRAFGGDLELEKTTEGEGTTFLIWFPRAPR